ncbi:MAG: RDD family protein, partial [Gemmatimonadaceae bacterium]|nr:RDD family protein [Gemmatimonadaceae bacterium]
MATTARPLEQTVDVETPELVLLSYSVAGVGSRVLAALTDYAICAVALIALVVALIALEPRLPSATPAGISWAAAVLILAQFAVLWGYYVLFEGLMDGQTPGKRIHRLRVVREGGFSVTFGASAVRNLVRFVDMQPVFFYLVGLGSILATRRGQRLGDLVAGTIVVREALRPPRAAAIAPSTALDASETPTLQTALSEDEFRVLDRFME